MTIFDWLTGGRPKAKSAIAREMTAEQAIDAVCKLGELMERNPLAILDIKRLPLSKAGMKTALKIAWQIAPNDDMRKAAEAGYLHLSQFQEGVGDTPIDPTLPPNCPPEEVPAILAPYLARSDQMKADADALMAEMAEFKRSMSKQTSAT